MTPPEDPAVRPSESAAPRAQPTWAEVRGTTSSLRTAQAGIGAVVLALLGLALTAIGVADRDASKVVGGLLFMSAGAPMWLSARAHRRRVTGLAADPTTHDLPSPAVSRPAAYRREGLLALLAIVLAVAGILIAT